MAPTRLVLLLLAAALAGGIAGVCAAWLTAREFEASTLLTTHPKPARGAFPVDAAAPGADRGLNSDARLLRIGPVRTIALKQLPARTPDEVRDQVQAVPVPNTFLLEIKARGATRKRAAALANAFANALVVYRREWDTARLRRAGDAVAARLASLDDESLGARDQRRILERRLAAIGVQDAFGEPPLEVVDEARSGETAARWPWPLYGAVGVVIGLMLALLLMAAPIPLSRRRLSPGELARIHDHRLLGRLPRHASLRTPLNDDGVPADVSAAVEHLTEEVDRRRREGTHFVLIASAARFEGRSTVALAVARALARRGLRVLVLEADMAHPKLADLTGHPSKPGLAAFAGGTATLDEVIHKLTDTGRDAGGIYVLYAGDRVSNPGHVLELPAVRRGLEMLRPEFDAVLMDAPAGFLGAELGSMVDGVLVVARPGMASRHRVVNFARELRATHSGAIMGLVLNALRRDAALH